MRNLKFGANKFYRLFNNGAGGQNVFIDDEDKSRFIFLLIYMQSPTPISNSRYYAESFLKKRVFKISEGRTKEILKSRYLEVLAFSVTDNSFEVLIKNMQEDIVPVYMHRILTSYSKYFNSKYKKGGHVFESTYKAELIGAGSEVLKTSSNVHRKITARNTEIPDYENYNWSSFRDYIGQNRFGELFSPKAVLGQFKDADSYREYVATNKP